MNKHDPKLETSIIRTITDGTKEKRSQILSALKPEHFGYEYTNEIFEKLITDAKRGKEIPKARTLARDPSLSEEARNLLKGKHKPLTTRDLDSAIGSIENFRKARVLVTGIDKGLKRLQKMNVTGAEKAIEKALFGSHTSDRGGLVHNEEIEEIANNILKEKHCKRIATGFRPFDIRSGGFPKGGVVILSAPPGGMKTAMMISMATRMYLHEDVNVCIVSLEMSKEEIIERQMANIAQVDFTKIQLKTMSPKEKIAVSKKYKNFRKFEKATSKRFSIYAPTDDVTFMQTINELSPFGYNIIFYDYIGLFLQDESMDEWRAMRETTRVAKRMAQKDKNTHVLLAQLNDKSGELKYATGVKDNCLIGRTLVNTGKGLTRLDSFSDRYINEKTVGHTGKTTASLWHDKGFRNIRTLTTKRGYSLSGTAKERVLVLDKNLNYTWKRLNKINKEDYVPINRKVYEWPSKNPQLPEKPKIPVCKNNRVEIVCSECRNTHIIDKKEYNRKIRLKKYEMFCSISCSKKYKYKGKNVVRKDKPEAKEIYNNKINGNYVDFKVPKKTSKDFATFVGLLVAEGSFSIDSVTFTNYNKTLLNLFETLCYSLFNIEAYRGKTEVVLNSKLISKYLDSLGLRGNSREKIIPNCILMSRKDTVKSFLRAYFEGDGNVSSGVVSCCSYSIELITQIHVILLQFGIISTLKFKNDKYKGRTKRNKKSLYGTITITGKDAKIFMKEIGFITKGKSVSFPEKDNTNVDIVPHLSKYLKNKKIGKNSIVTENGETKLLSVCRHGFMEGRNISYSSLINGVINMDTLKTFFPSLRSRLKIIIKDNFYWDKVSTNIKEKKKQKVYDLTTESHSFVANGIVVHNCDHWWKWIADEAAKEAGYIDIEQGKARNSPVFDFRVGIKPKYMSFFEADQVVSSSNTESEAIDKYEDLEAGVTMEEEEF